MKYLKYLWYVLKHKWAVFLECRKRGLWLIGILHDWSKFRPSEFFPYAEHFYGDNAKQWRDRTGYYKPIDTGDPAFDLAWFFHQKRNKHHWQYWTQPDEESGSITLDIPNKYLAEMLCDWYGAARAQKSESTVAEWYAANVQKMQLHRYVKADLDDLLGRGL